MNWKKLLIFLILFLVFFMIILIITIQNLLKPNEEDEQNNINKTNIISNISSDDTIDYNESDYIFEHEEETGDVQYNKEQLNNFEFTISMPDEVWEHVPNTEDFNMSMKEYIYLNGLVDATEADFRGYNIQEDTNILTIMFELNNFDKVEFKVEINLNNNQIQFIK